jgi:two-component system sensor histidine kinase TctE
VTVSVQKKGTQVALTVEDNGPGLSEAQREHVFERFWRGSDLPGGCGLGLAIVQEIARHHQGEAQVTALEPQGLRVTLNLTA